MRHGVEVAEVGKELLGCSLDRKHARKDAGKAMLCREVQIVGNLVKRSDIGIYGDAKHGHGDLFSR